jgi:hypothetical protein
MYHQSWFIFAESDFARPARHLAGGSGQGLKCLQSKGKITLYGFLFNFSSL